MRKLGMRELGMRKLGVRAVEDFTIFFSPFMLSLSKHEG
jgi:hypothetical protein